MGDLQDLVEDSSDSSGEGSGNIESSSDDFGVAEILAQRAAKEQAALLQAKDACVAPDKLPEMPCAQCDYDLRASLRRGCCPECGWKITQPWMRRFPVPNYCLACGESLGMPPANPCSHCGHKLSDHDPLLKLLRSEEIPVGEVDKGNVYVRIGLVLLILVLWSGLVRLWSHIPLGDVMSLLSIVIYVIGQWALFYLMGYLIGGVVPWRSRWTGAWLGLAVGILGVLVFPGWCLASLGCILSMFGGAQGVSSGVSLAPDSVFWRRTSCGSCTKNTQLSQGSDTSS